MISHGYVDSTVAVDLVINCRDCGSEFLWTIGQQEFFEERGLHMPRRCGPCYIARRNGNAQNKSAPTKSTALARRQPAVPASARRSKRRTSDLPAAPGLVADKNALFADIEQLLMDATAPVVYRRRTFFEWLGGVDPVAKQLAQKMELARTADEMVQQRTALFEHMQQMLVAATNAELTRIESQVRLRQAQLQMLELDQEIEKRQVLQGDRLKTHRLEEATRQVRLLAEVRPQEPSEEKALTDHRKRVRSKATAKQLIISDFLKELQKVYRANVQEAEKAMRVRAVMQAYGQEPDSLPRDIREFLERVEDEGDIGRG